MCSICVITVGIPEDEIELSLNISDEMDIALENYSCSEERVDFRPGHQVNNICCCCCKKRRH
jgi:hypothetical protein